MPHSVLKEISGAKVYSCTLYDGIIKELIKSLKYKNKKQLSPPMAKLMYEYWQKISTENYLVLPVPIHKTRLKERKYNHMDVVSKDFCDLVGYKYNTRFLLRTKDTQKQFKLNKQERIKNIKNAFELNLEKAPDKNTPLLIIDDITSTGITLEEIIKLLQRNGYKNITALTLATPDIWN